MSLGREFEEKRRFVRFENSFNGTHRSHFLSMMIPTLSDEVKIPEDFSAGGFRLKLNKPPEEGLEVECNIQLFDITLSGLKGRVAWVSSSYKRPPEWSVGLGIELTEGERDVLASFLTAILTGSRSED